MKKRVNRMTSSESKMRDLFPYHTPSISDWAWILEPNVQSNLRAMLGARYAALGAKLRQHQSPIQKVLLMRLEDKWLFDGGKLFPNHNVTMTFDPELHLQSLAPSFTHRSPDIILATVTADHSKLRFAITIECDTIEYDAFERMRDDNELARQLMMMGYDVIRFYAPEVVRNASECADDFFEILKVKLKDTVSRKHKDGG